MSTHAGIRLRWIALGCLPLKAFVVLAIPAYFIFRMLFPKPLLTELGNNTTVIDPLAQILLMIFALCGPVLLAASTVQLAGGERKPGIHTLAVAIVPSLVFGFFAFIWIVQHLL